MSDVYAEARQTPEGHWYVYWETGTAYGARGANLTQEAAEDLAKRLREGEEKV